MTKNIFTIFLAMLLLNLSAFAQTEISTKEQFLAIQEGGNYVQTADINLGNVGTRTAALIQNFSGTYDGNGYTITYQATFEGNNVTDASFGLFGHVTGTIKNLNVNGEATISGNGSDMQIGLLCGKLANSQTETSSGNQPVNYSYTYKMGTISHCSVSGNVTSTVYASNGGGTDAGLIVGQCEGTVEYCMGTGNVTGVGYVGGLVGQLRPRQYRERYQQQNGWWEQYNDVYRDYVYYPCSITSCAFIGNVTAENPESTEGDAVGSFAGGICGFAYDNSTIEQCYASGTITSNKAASGIVSTAINGGGGVNVDNNHSNVTLVARETNTVTNSITNSSNGGNTGNDTNSFDIDDILDALNASNNDDEAHFEYIGGKIVLVYGKVCEAPKGLSVVKGEDGNYTATWSVAGEDRSVTETLWHWELSGGNLGTEVLSGSLNATTLSSELEPSPNSYTFTVYTDCTASKAGLISESASVTFEVTCPIPTNLEATNVTYESFDISWTSDADCQLLVNGQTYIYAQGSSMTKSLTGLTPNTDYPVTVKAKCGNQYVKEATKTIRTASLPTPTNLSVNPVWNGTSGTATITWTSLDGMTYEVNTADNTQTSPYQITGLEAGSHTAQVRTVKTINGTKYYSEWATMSYTISEIPAPSNPIIDFVQDGNTYDVTISWTAGTTPNNGWKIGETPIATPSYTLQNQIPGSSTIVAIQEVVGEGLSRPLNVTIDVPCLPVGEVTVTPTQTTVRFDFANTHTNRVIHIGETSYPATEMSIVLTGLESNHTYSYEVREYCTTTKYSTTSGNFTTYGCYQVTGLSVSNVKITTATVSWQSQNALTGLKYKITLNGVEQPEQPEQTINFTTLSPSTTYTVSVQEQCGEAWGDVVSVSFTTQSADFVTVASGNFDEASTWLNGRIPEGNIGQITIQAGHIVELTNTLYVTSACQFINNGILRITQDGELISDNNVSGIVEIETAELPTNKWSFIGAPLNGAGGKYKLEAILRGTKDISVSMFDYTTGAWSTGENEWATYETEVGAGEGFFAWSFAAEPTVFTTYGETWDYENNTRIEYSNSTTPTYWLNNAPVTVNKTLNESYDEAYWMALANPYTFKLDINKFLTAQTGVQGGVSYRLTYNASNQPVWQTVSTGQINITEGFFVNFATEGAKTVNFNKNQRYTGAKKSAEERDFIKLTMIEGENESDLFFTHNQEAEQEYDIFDANKMFSPAEVSEPYFVTEGKALVKEEVKTLPYYATMNIRSFENKEVSFKATNIPQGVTVTIIDGDESIRLEEGEQYTTNITSGENADRFKVLFGNIRSLEEALSSKVEIVNYNREVKVSSEQKDLTIMVYDALGRKVLETKERNFTLEDVTSGIYMIKAFNQRVSETTKIVIE